MRLEGEHVLLREAQPADAEPLAAMLAEPEVQRWWGEYPIERVRAELLDNLVIERGGDVVGWLAYEEESDPQFPMVSLDISLVTQVHGQGYGSEALRLVIRHFIAKGHHRFSIDPAADNERAIRAYEAVGFKRIGIMRRYEVLPGGGYRDGLLMDLLAEELED